MSDFQKFCNWYPYYNFENKILILPEDYISDLIGLPNTTQEIIFCETSKIKYLYGKSSLFDKPLGKLPKKLKKLTFGYSFKQSVDNLPCGLIHLTFGSSFNNSVDSLP